MKFILAFLISCASHAGAADCGRCARLESLLAVGPIGAASAYLEKFKFAANPAVAQQEANLIMQIMAKYRAQDADGYLGEMWYSIYLDGRSYMTNALESQISEGDRRALRVLYKRIGQTWFGGNG